MEWLQGFEPGVLVGCEDTERMTGLRQHLPAFKHNMVFVAMEHDALMGQGAQHMGIAGMGCGFVVVVGKHSLDPQGLGQFGDGFPRVGMVNDHPHAFGTCRPAQRP